MGIASTFSLRTLSSAAVVCAAVYPLSAAPPKIPLCPGLTIVTAIARPEGDYESIKTIGSDDATAVHLRYSVERVQRELVGHPLQRIKVARTIHRADLRSADRYLQEFGYSTPPDVPGTTALGTSAAVLRRLKDTGTADLAVFDLPSSTPTDTPYSA